MADTPPSSGNAGPNPDLSSLNIARALTEELRYQRADLEEILGVKRSLNSFDKALLDLHRKLETSASNLNTKYHTTRTIAKEIVDNEERLLKIQAESSFHMNKLSTSGKDLAHEIHNATSEQARLSPIYQDQLRIATDLADTALRTRASRELNIENEKDHVKQLNEAFILSGKQDANAEIALIAAQAHLKFLEKDNITKILQAETQIQQQKETATESKKQLDLQEDLGKSLQKKIDLLGGDLESEKSITDALLERRKKMSMLESEANILRATQLRNSGALSAADKLRLDDIESLITAQGAEYYALKKIAGENKNIDRAVASRLLEEASLDLISKLKAQETQLKEVNKQFGLTGAALSSMEKIAGKLGFGHLSGEIKEIGEAIKEEINLKVVNGEIITSADKLEYMKKAIKGVGSLITTSLNDPLFRFGMFLTVLDKIFTSFLKVNKASVDLQRLTGQNSATQAGFNNLLIDSVDYLTIATELTQKMGMNAQSAFSPDTIARAAELKNTLGLAADEAAGLALMAQTSGISMSDTASSVVETTSAFNKANKSAISQGIVLKDVAKTSDHIKAALGNNPKALAEAATAARRLGMDLSQVDKIADSLMDFESSIQNQLEAQLLTGRAINLDKAREMALNNDLAGLSKELFKNAVDLNSYGKMNRIQQESYANALGMSKDDLAKMAYNRALELHMTKEQAAEAAGVKLEDMERLQVQESLQKSLSKLAQAFAPMLEILIQILKPLTWIMGWVSWAIGGVFKLVDAFGGLNKNATSFGNIIKDIVKAAVGIEILWALGMGSFFKVLTGGLIKAISQFGILNKLKSIFTRTPIPPGGGPGGILSRFDSRALLRSAGALVLMTGALFIFAKASQELAQVDWDKAGEGLKWFGGLIGVTALLGSISEGMIEGAIAMAIMGGALIPFALALKLMSNINGDALIAAGAALLGFSIAVFALGALMDTGVGAVLFGSGLIAIIGLGLAIGILGIGLASLSDGLSPVTDFIKSMGSNLGDFLKLGEGLKDLGEGLIDLNKSAKDLSNLEKLAELSPDLKIVGDSLSLISNSITSLTASLGTLNIDKLKELSEISLSPLQKIGAAAQNIITEPITPTVVPPNISTQGTTITPVTSQINPIINQAPRTEPMISAKEFYAKMDELIGVVKKGGDVFIDGNKVGYALTLGSTKLS